jgi:RNA polymerase sigma factor (sigma-70 family)
LASGRPLERAAGARAGLGSRRGGFGSGRPGRALLTTGAGAKESWRGVEPNTAFDHLEGVTALRRHEQDAGPDPGEAGFEDLYRRTYGGLLALAIATVRNRPLAEDLVQDAYAQLWTQWASVTQPTAWLRRAVISNCLASLRTQRRRDALIRRRPPAPATTAPDEKEFLDLLTGLNDRQRIALTLHYVHDLPEAEIASALGCRPGTVKSTLHRAIQVLRARIEGESS